MIAIRQTAIVKADGIIEVKASNLPPGQTVEVLVLVGPSAAAKQEGISFLKVASELNLDGPPDWSERFEEYLEGARREHARP